MKADSKREPFPWVQLRHWRSRAAVQATEGAGERVTLSTSRSMMSKAAFLWMSLRMYCSTSLTMDLGTRRRYVLVSSSMRSCSREKGLSHTRPAMLGSLAPYCRLPGKEGNQVGAPE